MRASYHFRKTQNGLTAYASVEVDVSQTERFNVTWAKDAVNWAAKYGESVEQGARLAMGWHVDRNGLASSVRVVGLTELIVDTRADAVRCAAAAATWKALGHDEACLNFRHDGNQWCVLLGDAHR